MADRVRRWGKKRVIQIDVTNRDCVVPPQELCCPEFCFKLDYDFKLKKKQEGIKGLYDEQRDRFSTIINALLNTSGGVAILQSILPINKSLLSTWVSNASQLLVCVPRDVLDCGAVDYIIHNNKINILVKKAPDIITFKSHMYIRSTDANSNMCYDAKVVRSMMMQKDSSPRTRVIPHIYGWLLDPEDRLTEFKYFKVTKSEEIIVRLEKDVNCIFALGNIPGGGDVFVGVKEDGQKYIIKGIDFDPIEQNRFLHDFSQWMVRSRDGAHRIWGDENTVPAEGSHWRVNFFPLSGCPPGQQRFLLQIHINFCQGGLFERAPESYTVDNRGHISLLSFHQWKKMVLCDVENDETVIRSSEVKKVEASPGLKHVETQTSPENVEIHTRSEIKKKSLGHRIKKSIKPKRQPKDSAKHPKKPDNGRPSSSQNTEPQPSTSYAAKDDAADDQDGLGAVSWVESQSNVKYLTVTGHYADTSYLTQPCTIPEGDPIQFFPNRDKFVQLVSSLIDPVLFPHEKILHTLIQVEDRYQGQPGFAIPLLSWAEQIGLDSKEKEFGHLFDILVGCGSNLDVWPVFQDMISDQSLKRCYAYELCRLLKRNLLLETKRTTMQTLRINPVLYHPDSGSVESGLDQTLSLVRDINDTWSSRDGVSKFALMEDLISLLMAGTNTEIKDRFGREKHYTLTTMQLRSSLQCLNGIVNMIEGPPGVGKSILVSYLCDVYGGHEKKDKVLCLCPRKPFSKYLEFQDKSTVVHIDSPERMQEVIKEIDERKYDAVVVDDSQDMSLTDKIWASLYLVIYQIWSMNSSAATRLFIFLDSKMQIFGDINQARISRAAFRKFIDKHHISFTDLSLHKVLRNTQNVFSFMVANVFGDPTLKDSEIFSRHPHAGDDVTVLGKANLWEDSANNALLKHILELLSRYEISDIVVLVDREEDAVFLRKLFQRCWPAARPSIIVTDATIFPVCGLIIDTTHNFLGLEARVCIHARRAGNTRVLNDTRYRIYITSRGTDRVDFLFPSSFDANSARSMGYEDLTTAKSIEKTKEPTDKTKGSATARWRKTRYENIRSLAVMGDGSCLVVSAAGITKRPDGLLQLSSSTLEAFSPEGEPVTLPFPCSAIRPKAIGINRSSTTVVVVDGEGESGRQLSVYSKQGDSWQYSSFSTRRIIQAAAITDDGCILCTAYSDLQQTLVLMTGTGQEEWTRSLQEGKYITYICVSKDLVFASSPNNNTVTVINRQGDLVYTLPSGLISRPRGVTSDSTGHLVIADWTNKSISLFTPEGRFIKTLVNCQGRPNDISLSQDRFLLVCEGTDGKDDLCLYELH